MIIQIKIIFSFMGHIINTRKGSLWNCLFPGQYSRNFLQNLEGKFIKSRSKSKALIHYPTGCPRRHCTPDTFIYFILHALYGSGRSLWEPLMVLTELYVSSHPLWPLPGNSLCSRDAGIGNDDSQCTVGAQAIRCAEVGTTRPPWQWWRGCCATPTNTLIC